MISRHLARNNLFLYCFIFKSLPTTFYFSAQSSGVSGIHTIPTPSTSQLNQYHPHILPNPLPPGEVDSDSANDGEGDDELGVRV